MLCIKTGVWPGAGTTANVCFIIYGHEGNSGTLKIPDNSSGDVNPIFARGAEQSFAVFLDKDLGEICALRVWHDNFGDDPSWYLEQVTIKNPKTGGLWKFIFESWLSLEDKSLSNEMIQKPSFSDLNINNTAVREMFCDGHLWISVITKTPGDCFTRVQRMSSCFCLLLCTMAANAAFYRSETQSSQTINMGPFQFSARQAVISVQSSLLILPLHVIIALFKKSSAHLKRQHSRRWLCVFYAASVLFTVFALASATVTIFYSLSWGSEKSQEWLSSVITSFLQDVLVVQPSKCLLLVSLSVMFAKCRAKKVFAFQKRDRARPVTKVTALSMTPVELSKLKREVAAKARHRWCVRQIGFYVTFLIAIGVLSYGNRDYTRYLLSKSLDDHLGNIEKVRAWG